MTLSNAFAKLAATTISECNNDKHCLECIQ